MTTFGIIGAGHIRSQVARAVLGLGHDVVIANSRGPETLTDLIDEPGPRARADNRGGRRRGSRGGGRDGAEAAEVAVVTVPR